MPSEISPGLFSACKKIPALCIGHRKMVGLIHLERWYPEVELS
jgi:hypothetical protein